MGLRGPPKGVKRVHLTLGKLRPERKPYTRRPPEVIAAEKAALAAGWNLLTPLNCYGFAYGADIIVKLNGTDGKFVQSRNATASAAMLLACAASRAVWVYSRDGVSWEGALLSAQ